jgi:hypothetical protein
MRWIKLYLLLSTPIICIFSEEKLVQPVYSSFEFCLYELRAKGFSESYRRFVNTIDRDKLSRYSKELGGNP